jgi:predicted CXXCH cytochrome family protein
MKIWGVIMGVRKDILVLLLFVFVIFPLYPCAVNGALSDEAKVCLTCHSNTGMYKVLENKEVLSLYIDKNDFATSAHNGVGCNGCHTGYMAAHMQKKKEIKSRKEYAKNASQICLICHPDDQLKKIPIHNPLMKQASCVECHGSHYIKKMEEWKKGISETQYCFSCHKQSISKTLSSGEVLSLSVSESDYKASVHGRLSCGACHTDFSKTKHPVRTIKNRREYAALSTKSCSTCHTDAQLRKSPVHSSLLATASCVECHGSHAIKSIVAQKAGAPENQYCLSCHKGKLSMSLRNGESLSVFVDASSLKSSVHANLRCTECHSDFSKNKHPVRVFLSRRDYSIAASDLCGKCHSDANTKYKNSIHHALIRSANVIAPVCGDCHGSHAVAKAGKDLGFVSCNKCHQDMKASYEESVHNKARMKGVPNAPTCASCHHAHDVQSTKMTAKIKDACLACHKNAQDKHEKWLYNPPLRLRTFTELHFNTVACAACHAPSAERGIYLNLYDSKTGKPLPEEELLTLLDTDPSGLAANIDTNGDGIIDSSEVWNLFKNLYSKGVSTSLIGKMDVSTATEAHDIVDKTKAVRDCGTCHNPDSPFFKEVFLVIRKADGRPIVFNAGQDVLGKNWDSVYTIIPTRKFYVLGSTNLKLWDILFIVALIGGIAVPIGHLSLRIITSPLRSLRKMKKGGKK